MSVLSVVARRFVAGESAADAVQAARALSRQGLKATLDFLGEDVSDRRQAEAAAEEYRGVLRRLAEAGLEPNVSLKLTQFGVALDRGLCVDLVRSIVEEAEGLDGFVRIDMEGSAWTQTTLEVAREVDVAGRAGVVIQAMLRRSPSDIDELSRRGVRVRLCKGAYKEPPAAAFQSKEEVDRQFDLLAEKLLKDGRYPAIATHDDERIRPAVEAARRAGRSKDDFELQMLYGLRRRRWAQLAADGHRFRVYVPYGSHWLPYFSRRLRERKENLLFVLKNLWKD